MKANQNKNSNKKIYEKFLKSFSFSKKNNLIKSHTEAFQDNPIEEEKHQGKTTYYK